MTSEFRNELKELSFEVLIGAIHNGLIMPSWEQDTFAYAESYDDALDRYRGLRGGKDGTIVYDSNAHGMIVKTGVARRQIDTETAEQPGGVIPGGGHQTPEPGDGNGGQIIPGSGEQTEPVVSPRLKKRYYGSVALDPQQIGKNAGQIGNENITHLLSLSNVKVRVALEIEVDLPEGAPEYTVRTVTENSRTLKFTSFGFEEE